MAMVSNEPPKSTFKKGIKKLDGTTWSLEHYTAWVRSIQNLNFRLRIRIKIDFWLMDKTKPWFFFQSSYLSSKSIKEHTKDCKIHFLKEIFQFQNQTILHALPSNLHQLFWPEGQIHSWSELTDSVSYQLWMFDMPNFLKKMPTYSQKKNTFFLNLNIMYFSFREMTL